MGLSSSTSNVNTPVHSRTLVKLQQLDYEKEQLRHVDISYPDNSEQLALLDSRMGVMGRLDEECALPKGSEAAYVEKMHKFFVQSPYYEKPARGGVAVKRRSVLPSVASATSKDVGTRACHDRTPRGAWDMHSRSAARDSLLGATLLSRARSLTRRRPLAARARSADKLQFSITHYAGKVTYTAEAWLDKNRGFLQPDLAFLMRTSSNPLLQTLFTTGRQHSKLPTDGKKRETVLSSFRQSLKALSATLLQTSARYIRCVKPNALKVAGHFDGRFIARQLRYTGVSAVVEIQRSGYPISL